MAIGNKKMLIATGAVLLCAVVGLALLFGGNTQDRTKTADAIEARRDIVKERRNAKKQKIRSKRRETARSLKSESRLKPNLVMMEDVEERELTDLARKVLASLQAALDSEDYEQIVQIYSMAQNAPKGSLGKTTEGMPVALRKKMIEALGWFGAQALPEMVGYLGDDNPDVAQMALDQFVMALSDISLGDRARASIVTMASSVLTDSDALGQIFIEISNMRNSVAASTIYSICDSGTPEAKAMMPETIEFITGEEGITTVEGLEEWVKKNPDGADDEDLYGPIKVD